MHNKFIYNALDNIEQDELTHLSKYLNFCLNEGLSILYLTECYLTIVEDTLREQLYFSKHKEYRHKSFNDVANDVYFNESYMHRYMYGLALTSFLWPNHVEMFRFYKKTFPQDKNGTYLEIGPGHGYYMLTSILNGNFNNYVGIDISETSIKQTKSIINHFNPEASYKLELKQNDFLSEIHLNTDSYDAVVMGEVLEHVEKPELFLHRIATVAKPDAHIYITTCINAPAIDHIYLWRDITELEDMIQDGGLTIKKALRLPYKGKTLSQSIHEGLAINVAYVLEKS